LSGKGGNGEGKGRREEKGRKEGIREEVASIVVIEIMVGKVRGVEKLPFLAQADLGVLMTMDYLLNYD